MGWLGRLFCPRCGERMEHLEGGLDEVCPRDGTLRETARGRREGGSRHYDSGGRRTDAPRPRGKYARR